jgi:signal transduction histidine kinase
MRSVRFRLTVWNVLVLLIVLVSFGVTAALLTERAVLANVDRDLVAMTERMRPPTPGMGGFQQRQGPMPPREEPRPVEDAFSPRAFGPDGVSIGPPGAEMLSASGFRAATEQGRDLRTERVGERAVRVMSLRREVPNGFQVVQFGRDLTEAEAALAQLRTVLLLMLPVAVVVAAVGGHFLVGRALKPVEDVTQAAAKIGAEDLSMRLEVQGDDELAELARTFNGMIARLDTSFSTLEEAYEAQKRFVADASHELRTPLSRIKLVSSSMLTQPASDEEKTHALRTIDTTTDEMTRLIEGLLQLARAEAGALVLARERVDLAAVARDAVESLAETRVVITGEGAAAADPDAVRRIVVNLVSNALRHAAHRVEVTVSGPTLTVTDDGEGIAPEHLVRVKERFYRADASRTKASGGAGLGLAICDSLARAMGGTLTVESEVGKGTTATLELPSV